MATETPVENLLKELKETTEHKEAKQRYKVARPYTAMNTFRELMDSSQDTSQCMCGDIIYEYWDDIHFRSTWVERRAVKVYWDEKKKDGDWKWRPVVQFRSVIEPHYPHIEDGTADWNYHINRGIPLEIMKGKWSDPTRDLQYQLGWRQGPVNFDIPIRPFVQEASWSWGAYKNVEVHTGL